MPSKFVCQKCGLDCPTSIAYQSHSKRCTGTSTVATATPATKPMAIEQAVVATPTETVTTVKPTVEIADPFLSTRVVPPHIGTGVGESTAKPAETAATASEQLATVSEQPAVEPQKKTVVATAETTTLTAEATQSIAGKPVVPPIHIHLPPLQKITTLATEGHRDRPRAIVVDESRRTGEGKAEPVI